MKYVVGSRSISLNRKVSKIVKAINFIILSRWYMLPINIYSVMVSWYFNHSIFWAIFHWIFAIPNLIYRLLIGSFKDGGFTLIINSYT